MHKKLGRPVEMHIRTVDAVDLDSMPLIVSMAYGERHVSRALNMATTGIVSPGFYSGFIPEPAGGLFINVKRDPETKISVASVNSGMQQIRIFQQHDVKLELVNGIMNVVVLEGFYEDGTVTSQVSANSTTPPARLRVLEESEVNSEHIIVCKINLDHNPLAVEEWMIDLTDRTTADLNVAAHEAKDDPHPQYNPRQVAHILEDDTVELSTTNINLVVGPYARKLRPYKDGTMIRIEVLSSVDLDATDIILTPPDGEVLHFSGDTGNSYNIMRRVVKMYRYKGRWHI